MSRKTILVVDDEKPQRDILQEILTAAGYDVTSAASGEAALKFAKERSFDLALTDLKMTGMDGIELLQQLLAHDSSIIVILLTAHGTIDSAKDALRRGAFDYLQKPSGIRVVWPRKGFVHRRARGQKRPLRSRRSRHALS